MKNKTVVLAGGLLATLASVGAAFAGWHHGTQVHIDDGAKNAWGSLGIAYNSFDDKQFISCQTYHAEWLDSPRGECEAQDAEGNTRGCLTSDPKMIAIIQSISGDSYVDFMWRSDGTCKYVRVDNSSYAYPKKP